MNMKTINYVLFQSIDS